jgi:ABC-type Na+ efflux pump permease subunit
MTEDAGKRRPRRFPFLIMFLVVMILGLEYSFAIFGTFQIQSKALSLRGGGNSEQYAQATTILEKKMNDTIKFLATMVQKQSVSDERLVFLEQHIASLEDTLNATRREAVDGKAHLKRL